MGLGSKLKKGVKKLADLDPGHKLAEKLGGEGTSFSPYNAASHLYDASYDFYRAPFASNPMDALYGANRHFTDAHPGARETVPIVTDKWGVDVMGNLNGLSAGAGGILGYLYGPWAGAIGGAAAGWGLGSQFDRREEDDASDALEAAALGAGTGLAAGYFYGPEDTTATSGLWSGGDASALAEAEQAAGLGSEVVISEGTAASQLANLASTDTLKPLAGQAMNYLTQPQQMQPVPQSGFYWNMIQPEGSDGGMPVIGLGELYAMLKDMGYQEAQPS